MLVLSQRLEHLDALFLQRHGHHRDLHSFPTRRSSDLLTGLCSSCSAATAWSRFAIGLTASPRRLKSEAICSSDRKSTRLNSSHLGISYAVFCLKKKSALDPVHEPGLRPPLGGELLLPV